MLYRLLLVVILFTVSVNNIYSQLPDCNKYYIQSGSRIYTIDPATNNATVNSITLPPGASGLAVANNFFSATPAQTFYTIVSGTYRYWDGSSWVNTGHSSSPSAVNIGGAGPYIYNLNGLGARLYRYDGTGNGTLFLNLGTWDGPFDCMGDAQGNVYLLSTGNNQALRMYNPQGQLVCTYTLINMPYATSGGGYSIVNGIVYVSSSAGLFTGTISGTTITFTPYSISGANSASDMANCAFPPINVTTATPGDLDCSTTSVQLSATTSISNPQYSWSGPGIVSGGNTSTPTVNQPGTYTVTVTSGGGSGGCTGTGTQTVVVSQSTAAADASFSFDSYCYGTTGNVPYDIATQGGTFTFNPAPTDGATIDASTGVISNETEGATYTVEYSVTGQCASSSTVDVTIHETPDFTVQLTSSSCVPNTGEITIIGLSPNTTYDLDYDFNSTANGVQSVTTDANGSIVLANLAIGSYSNFVITSAGGCSTTVPDEIVINMIPTPTFLADTLQGCVPLVVQFTNTTGLQGASCLWNFGDGNTSTECGSVIHTFTSSGEYDITLTLTDSNNCTSVTTDTNYITVGSVPVASFEASPEVASTILPVINFLNTSEGADTYTWDFGDESPTTHQVNPIHTYPKDSSGRYTVTLVASGGIMCLDTATLVIQINEEQIFYIPNSFTPDEDKYNEVFKPVFTSGFDPQTYTFIVYNRWGEILFESHNINVGWDGTYGIDSEKIVPDGVYIWKIKIKEKGRDKHNIYKGSITLIR